ncbi:zinc finger domain-containing protein, partial [Chitinophaga sp. GbtcB8]|uniref:zinc finger domain-containing protein n=1 Tax=Chitinophaga sp. GbtcB8 TaxID=2824753 RepID=UPI00273A111F
PTYEEVAQGANKKNKVKKHVPCSHCNGVGAKGKNAFQTCYTCGGTGQRRRVTQTFLGQKPTVTPCPTCQGEGQILTSKCG